MTRKIIPHRFDAAERIFSGTLEEWLCKQASTPSWLLAHATDGVIWGWANQSELHVSREVAPKISPPLRLETLQQALLFNLDYEVRLWRAGKEWKAVCIKDIPEEGAAAIDEQQLLWGTHAEPLYGGFIRLEDGSQGLRHVIPPFAGSDTLAGKLGLRSEGHLSRVYLSVRHYLTEDDLGVNKITMSRLMELGVKHYA